MAAKTSPPPYDRSGTAGTGAPEEPETRTLEELGAGALEELEPNDRLLQKAKTKSEQENALNKTKTSKQLTGA